MISCLVLGATGAAFHVQDGSTSDLDDATGRNGEKGVYVGPTGSAVITNSTFSANDVGVHLYGATSSTFVDSHADSNTNEGMLCDMNSDPIISGSVLDANESGIAALNSSDPYVRECQINDNYVGLWCASGSEPDAGTASGFGNNSVVGTTTKHVANFTENYTFQALGNWWGTNPPPAKKFLNAVAYIPALDDPPAYTLDLGVPKGDPVDSVADGFIGTMPNPFNPVMTISYGVRSAALATLAIYNVKGQLVSVLFDERKAAGRHAVTWDGTDAKGQAVASGVYFARLKVNSTVQTRKLVLLK